MYVIVLPPVLVPRQSEYAPQQTLQQYQSPVDISMPMNVSLNTDGFPESALITNQTTSNIPAQIYSTTINSFSDTSLIGIYVLINISLFINYNDSLDLYEYTINYVICSKNAYTRINID